MEKAAVEKLKEVVHDFYNYTIEPGRNDNMCFTSNYPLSLHLKNKKLVTEFVHGGVNINECSNCHNWLKIDDIIIDLTPNQEQFKLPTLLDVPYVGEKPTLFTDGNVIDSFLDSYFKQWYEPLLDFIYGEPVEFYLPRYMNTMVLSHNPPKQADIDFCTRMTPVYLKYSVKAAIVLLNDIEGSNEEHLAIAEYLDIIYRACYGYGIERIESLLYNQSPVDMGKFIAGFTQWKINNSLP